MYKLKKVSLIILAIFLLVACANGTNELNMNSENVEGEIHITISLSQENGAEMLEEKAIRTDKSTNLLEIMQANFDVEEDNGFIQSIDGLATDHEAEMGWIYYVNDELAIVGAEDLTLSENDYVRFDYQAWE